MKKILILVGMLALTAASNAAVISTNVPGINIMHLLSSTRANVYQVELTAAQSCVVEFYDQNSLAAPYYGTNWVTGSYVSKGGFATNIVSSFTNAQGYTNFYTNTGWYTYSLTNAAATNGLPKTAVFVVAGGTYTLYNTDLLFTRGICMRATTNVSVVVNYNTGR